jgi:hypothetical protein
LVIKGLAGIEGTPKGELLLLDQVSGKSRDALLVIGGAHTLAIAEEIIIGDPLEKQAFEGIKFKQALDGTRVSSGPGV